MGGTTYSKIIKHFLQTEKVSSFLPSNPRGSTRLGGSAHKNHNMYTKGKAHEHSKVNVKLCACKPTHPHRDVKWSELDYDGSQAVT